MDLPKQKNYQQSFELACASMLESNLEERAQKAGVVYQKTGNEEKIIVDFFSDPYHILFPRVEFYSPSKKTVSLVTRILILHHLLRADGNPVTGRWVGYKDIPGGLHYAGVFERRVIQPLVRRFGRSAREFQKVGLDFGGHSGDVGDGSVILKVFPYVSLQYVLWEGDEEFPAAVQLLFDASVDHYLSLEDIVVLGQMATGRLIHQSTQSSID